jgi:hypothetical protein
VITRQRQPSQSGSALVELRGPDDEGFDMKSSFPIHLGSFQDPEWLVHMIAGKFVLECSESSGKLISVPRVGLCEEVNLVSGSICHTNHGRTF